MLLKGPALARTVYPDPALRQSSDIDLLVRPGDVLAAEAVLEGLGYVSPKKEFHVSQHEFHHLVFMGPGNGMPLELHWALDTEFDMFPEGWVEEVMSRRVPIRAEDLSCHTLNPEDHLLFLAFHNVFVHRGRRLDWIVDTALVMAALQGVVDWQNLIERSVEHHIRIALEMAVASAGLWAGGRPDEARRLLGLAGPKRPGNAPLELFGHAEGVCVLLGLPHAAGPARCRRKTQVRVSVRPPPHADDGEVPAFGLAGRHPPRPPPAMVLHGQVHLIFNTRRGWGHARGGRFPRSSGSLLAPPHANSTEG